MEQGQVSTVFEDGKLQFIKGRYRGIQSQVNVIFISEAYSAAQSGQFRSDVLPDQHQTASTALAN